MTDIGFGLIDRRTVITVLFTMVLAQILFGYQIPIDIKNASNLFIDLTLLTGFLYLARSIYRTPVAFFISLIIVSLETKELVDNFIKNNKEITDNVFVKATKTVLIRLFLLIIMPIYFLGRSLFLTFTFGNWIRSDYKNSGNYFYILLAWYHGILDGLRLNEKALNPIFGLLDRIGVVAIAILATIPQLNILVRTIGAYGLLIMVVIFTLRGDFTSLVKDIIEKKEVEDEEKKNKPATEIKNEKLSPIYVEIVNSDERPVSISNMRREPLYIEHADTINAIPVSIREVSLHYESPLPVRVTNDIKVEVDNFSSIPVEVTNVVTVQNDGEE